MTMIPFPKDASNILELQEALNASTHEQRMEWATAVPMKQLHRLYELADGNALSLDALCDDDGQVCIHEGVNQIAGFRRFQKRFAKVGDDIVGYNHALGTVKAITWLQGHGPFTALKSPDVEGELWIDYRKTPAQHPEFPKVKKIGGFGTLVYGGMVDVTRKVSDHVSIGSSEIKSFKGGLHTKFALVRVPKEFK